MQPRVMTIEKNEPVARGYVTSVLPWLAGAVGLLVYFASLNRWISFLNVGVVAQTSGWLWRPQTNQPLLFALCYPFRWLPEPAIPLALNVFTAVCAAVVLALLARSVALLPHDLTADDPARKEKPVSILSTPTAWIPPVLAVTLCGLELSFWENATAASGAMIDLLVVAYVIRSVLEFRVQRNSAWLWRSAFVYAAGMTNNWALVGCLPVFLVAILRTNGLVNSLNLRFLSRMVFWGAAGLSLYLLLPVVQSLSTHGQIGFWFTLKLQLKAQLEALADLRSPGLRILVLMASLPILLLSIRWKSHTAQLGDDTPLGVFITKMTGHLVHGLFLVVSLWTGLDPAFSPRHLMPGMPLLTCYYISALVFGYCTGYFLLLEAGHLPQWVSRLPRIAVGLLVCVLPALLLWRNMNQLNITNGPELREFARQMYSDLPPAKSVVLSEDAVQLLLLRGELSSHSHEKEPILINTTSLPSPAYHAFMARQSKSRWPVAPPTNTVELVRPSRLRTLVSAFATNEPVVYLHPSSGLLMEPFTAEPHGLLHRLVPNQNLDIAEKTMSETVITANEQIWGQRWTRGLRTLAADAREETRLNPLRIFLHLDADQNFTASLLGAVYSKCLNYWGVEMQRLGQWKEAGVWFARALELNPDNLSAQINLSYNEQCRRGDKTRLALPQIEKQLRKLFVKYKDWPEVMSVGGPVDEPTFLLMTAQVWLPGGNSRQAIRALLRCSELAPNWPAPKLWLARSYLRQGEFTLALEATDEFRVPAQRLKGPGLADLLSCRVRAMWDLGHTNDAIDLLEDYVATYHEQEDVLAAAASLYAENLQFEQELNVLDELVKRDPNEVRWLDKKGLAQMQLSRFDAAVTTLTTAVSLAPIDERVRLHRAMAYLGSSQFDTARGDYQELLKTSESRQLALYGLGEIAWRQKDTNAAIQFYQDFISNSPPKSLRHAVATGRLKKLKSPQNR
jgi:tetratricopeptide (TPR) repeat protein